MSQATSKGMRIEQIRYGKRYNGERYEDLTQAERRLAALCRIVDAYASEHPGDQHHPDNTYALDFALAMDLDQSPETVYEQRYAVAVIRGDEGRIGSITAEIDRNGDAWRTNWRPRV